MWPKKKEEKIYFVVRYHICTKIPKESEDGPERYLNDRFFFKFEDVVIAKDFMDQLVAGNKAQVDGAHFEYDLEGKLVKTRDIWIERSNDPDVILT